MRGRAKHTFGRRSYRAGSAFDLFPIPRIQKVVCLLLFAAVPFPVRSFGLSQDLKVVKLAEPGEAEERTSGRSTQ
jgi:hypothetical protein